MRPKHTLNRIHGLRPWLLAISVLAGVLLGVFGFKTLPAVIHRFLPTFVSPLFTHTDNPIIQQRELANDVEAADRPRRVVQVDLAHHPKISQYTDIDSSPSGYGKNACGLVAAAAALGGADWTSLVATIARAAGKDFNPRTGIQPSKYAAALQDVFGVENVTAKNDDSLGDLYRDLEAGDVVIVDIKVNADKKIPSASKPNYAHFARVLGMDIDKEEIYLENTLTGDPYWTIPLDDFVRVWTRPETTASIILDHIHAEEVTRWAVVINGALYPTTSCINCSIRR